MDHLSVHAVLTLLVSPCVAAVPHARELSPPPSRNECCAPLSYGYVTCSGFPPLYSSSDAFALSCFPSRFPPSSVASCLCTLLGVDDGNCVGREPWDWRRGPRHKFTSVDTIPCGRCESHEAK